MKRIACLTFGVWTMAVVAAPLAQKPTQKVTLIQYMQIGHAGVTRDLLAAAELMPEADYGFRPTEMPDARTFGAVIAHTSAAMFDACARLSGAASPAQGAEKTVTPKTDVVQTLRKAIAFCNEVVDALDESSAGGYVRQGPAEAPRSAVLAGLLAHNAEMYGISTVYLRAKNIVPPASRR